MEEKKFDFNTIIGFVLIGGILLFMLYQNQPTPEELEAEKAKKEQISEENRTLEKDGLDFDSEVVSLEQATS